MSIQPIRIGLVGLDTSHAPAFTKILHDPYDPFHIPGAQVVAAYPGGSPDMEISISRVEGFTRELRDTYGVHILDAPEKVADACDYIFILASDGRVHPALFRSVADRRKPVFVDKPFAVSVADAEEMFTLAAKSGTRIFASSAFRYADDLVKALESIRCAGERVRACRVRCWLPVQETQGRYFWYGIHAAEMVLASMGIGACEVEAAGTGEQDEIKIRHRDGRESSIVGSASHNVFHVTIQTNARQIDVDLSSSMPALASRLLRAALDVLSAGKFPRLWSATDAGSVSGRRPSRRLDPSIEETMEIVKLLDAAQRSYDVRQRMAV